MIAAVLTAVEETVRPVVNHSIVFLQGQISEELDNLHECGSRSSRGTDRHRACRERRERCHRIYTVAIAAAISLNHLGYREGS